MIDPILLQTEEDLERVWASSRISPVIIFKHSLTCPISSAAFAEYQTFLADHDDPSTVALVQVQRARPVSNEIARRSGVRHESPQALVVDDGEVVWHASHGAITEEALREALLKGRGASG